LVGELDETSSIQQTPVANHTRNREQQKDQKKRKKNTQQLCIEQEEEEAAEKDTATTAERGRKIIVSLCIMEI